MEGLLVVRRPLEIVFDCRSEQLHVLRPELCDLGEQRRHLGDELVTTATVLRLIDVSVLSCHIRHFRRRRGLLVTRPAPDTLTWPFRVRWSESGTSGGSPRRSHSDSSPASVPPATSAISA